MSAAVEHNDHTDQSTSIMTKFFGQDEGDQLKREDNEALRNVSVLLATIIAIGVLIALVAIALTVPQ